MQVRALCITGNDSKSSKRSVRFEVYKQPYISEPAEIEGKVADLKTAIKIPLEVLKEKKNIKIVV